MNDAPWVLCIDVGSPKNIGWADSDGRDGSGFDLNAALANACIALEQGGRVALGFEAPIWTPVRPNLRAITQRRGGVEQRFNRPWSAGAGCGVLAAALALMPWCLSQIHEKVGPVKVTTDVPAFKRHGGLLLWEAFVSGSMKEVGASHNNDARLACRSFTERWPRLETDIPAEPALNHAISAALAVGLAADPMELTKAALVIGVKPQEEARKAIS